MKMNLYIFYVWVFLNIFMYIIILVFSLCLSQIYFYVNPLLCILYF